MSSIPPNDSSSPSRNIMLRSVLLTASFLMVVVLLLFVWYSRTHSTYNFLEFLDSSHHIGVGFVIGVLVIWLVYPKNYWPKHFNEFFPQADWVGLWYTLLGPLAVVILSGVSLFELHTVALSSSSPLTGNFYLMESMALLTYFLFYSALGFGVKNQEPALSTQSPSG